MKLLDVILRRTDPSTVITTLNGYVSEENREWENNFAKSLQEKMRSSYGDQALELVEYRRTWVDECGAAGIAIIVTKGNTKKIKWVDNGYTPITIR